MNSTRQQLCLLLLPLLGAILSFDVALCQSGNNSNAETLAATSASQKAAVPRLVRLTTGEWPPFCSERAEQGGLLPLVVREAYASQGYHVELAFLPWPRALMKATDGNWDGTIGWQRTKERELIYHFSQPLMVSNNVFFHRAGSSFNWSKLSDLRDLKIGTTRGCVYSPTFRSDARRLGLRLIDSDSEIVNLKLLARGRIDIFPGDQRAIFRLLLDQPTRDLAKQLTFHPRILSKVNRGVIFPRGKARSKELVEVLDKGLAVLEKTGRLEKLMAQDANTPKFRVAFDNWPPYKVVAKDSFGGIDWHVLMAASQRQGFALEFIGAPWKRCIGLIKSGQVDLISSLSRRSHREKFVHYLEPPYQVQTVCFYHRASFGKSPKNFEDLRGLRLGTVRGAAYFPRFDKDKELDKTSVAVYYQLLHMLAMGRIDVAVGFEGPTRALLNSLNFKDKIVKAPYSVVGGQNYLAISKKSRAASSRHLFSALFRQMIEDGTVARIEEHYLKEKKE